MAVGLRWVCESHFEITAIAGLLMLCYFFLPVYRKLHIFTLSDYLSKRFDDRSAGSIFGDHAFDHCDGDDVAGVLHWLAAVNILMVDEAEIQAQFAQLENGVIDSR